jgi:cell division protein FtsW
MVTTASPAVADRIGLSSSYFIKRQLIFLSISLFIVVLFSFVSTKLVQKSSTSSGFPSIDNNV